MSCKLEYFDYKQKNMKSKIFFLFKASIWNIKVWFIAGLFGYLIMRIGGSKTNESISPLWFIEPILYIFLGYKIFFNRTLKIIPLNFSPKYILLLYIIISFISGMFYELGLSLSQGSIGGLYPKTIPSFIVAQGFYWPFAIFSLLLIRRYNFKFSDLYFAALGASLTEGIVFNQVLPTMLLSPMFYLIPVIVAYYAAAYGVILGLPFVFIDEKLLWGKDIRQISLFRKFIYGFIMAFIAYAIFYGWYILMDFVFKGFKSFPA